MESSFADYEIMIIEKEIEKKPYRDIAFLVDRPVAEVSAFIEEFIKDRSIVPFQKLVDQKKSERAPVIRMPRAKKEKKKEPLIISRIIEQEQRQRRNRFGEVVYKTKVVDLSKLQEVKVDNKTWIYIRPGEDPQKAKEKYLQRLKECKSRYLENESMVKKVSNFKP